MMNLDAIPLHEHISRFEEIKREGKKRYTGSHRHQSEGGRCLTVYIETNSFYCFQCHAGGNILDYERDRLNVDEKSAYKSIAEQYNLESLSKDELNALGKRKSVSNTLFTVFKWYHSQIDKGMAYLADRGFTRDDIDQHLIGFAPKDYRPLLQFLPNHDHEHLLETGLFLPDQTREHKVVPLYQNRIIFPYFHLGRPVFSIGRAVGDDKRKYVKHLTKDYVNKDAVINILWQEDKIKPYSKLLVAEGITDAILLQQHCQEEIVISPVTTQWSNSQIDRLADATREVSSINFIADSEANNAGEDGVLRTASKLTKAWGNPDPEDMPELLITRLRRDRPSGKKDVADFIQSGEIKELDYWIDSAVPVDYEIARRAKNDKRFFSRQRGGFTPKDVANEILLMPNHFIEVGDTLYRYQGGYKDDDGQVLQNVDKLLLRSYQPEYGKRVAEYLKQRFHLHPDAINTDPYTLNTLNGLYDVRTGNLTPLTPKHLTTQRLNAAVGRYTDDDMSIVLTFLNEVLEPDAHTLVHEMIGYCLFADNRFQTSFMLVGKGATGKSTLLEMIAAMIGRENVSQVSLQQLDTDRFAPARLAGKLVNINADLAPKAIEDSSAFKMITSGEEMEAQRKYGKQFTFTPKATLIFSANQVPTSWDKGDGFWRRWIFLDMNRAIPEERRDPNLSQKLQTDGCRSALFQLAIIGLQSLLERGRFDIPDTSAKLLTEERETGDNTIAFCREVLTYKEGSDIPKRDVYTAYVEWCEVNGFDPVYTNTLSRRIKEQFPNANQSNTGGLRKWVEMGFQTADTEVAQESAVEF